MTRLELEQRRRVEAAPAARLATVRPDGRPHLVPITFALDGDTVVTAVDHKPKSTTALQRLRNIEANPTVSVLVDHYADDWSQLWWVRADGDARIVHEGSDHEQAVRALVAKYDQYREHAPAGPAIVIAVTGWASWQG